MVHHPILAGKPALVTGAASGIGRAIAIAFALDVIDCRWMAAVAIPNTRTKDADHR